MDAGSWHCIGDHPQEKGRDQDHPQEKEMQKINMPVWGGLTNNLWKEDKWKANEKRTDVSIWMQNYKEKQGEIRKPSSVISAKK